MSKAAVVAKSRTFHWVEVDRDKTPAIPKRFHVSAYPSLLVLGDEGENVWRWQGFKEEKPFLAELDAALARWQLYRAGKAWDAPRPRAATLCDTAGLDSLPAPAVDVPSGIVESGGDLWVAQGDTLFCLAKETAAFKHRVRLGRVVQDIASDGTSLYTIDARWTQGGAIHVIDVHTGRRLRAIVTAANKGKRPSASRGLAWHDGKLWVLEIFGKLHRLDPRSGDIEASFDIGKRWTFGLASTGTQLVAGSREAVYFIDPSSGKVTRSIKVRYKLRAIGATAERVYAMEQPTFGFDRRHDPVQVWPRPGQTRIWRLPLVR